MNVFITGASGNLGEACLQKFSLHQWSITALVRSKADQLKLKFPSVHFFNADLNNVNGLEQVASDLKPTQFDAMLFLAGGFEMGSLNHADTSLFNRLVELNFLTAVKPLQVLLKNDLVSENAKVIFIGSAVMESADDFYNNLWYALSKNLLYKLSESINNNIRNKWSSVMIQPTTIDTPQNRLAMPDADFSSWVKPETVASIIFKICSETRPHASVVKITGK